MITYSFKLRPNKEQENSLWLQLKLTRELYNNGLDQLISIYRETGKYINRFAHDKIHSKKEHPDIPSVLVDTTLDRLHLSFINFFRRCKQDIKEKGFPRFKPANRWRSLSFRDMAHAGISGNYFKGGKKLGGRIRFNLHRKIDGNMKFCRVIRKPSGWILQVVCENKVSELSKIKKSIGLDFGIKNLIADSDGNITENPQFLKNNLKKLRVAQRKIARRKRGSNRRKKACRLAARIHERISNQRKDYYHKTARKYVNSYDKIYLEDLTPLKMVQNSNWARDINDASWSMLRRIIEVKAENAGRQVIAVSPHYTSQKCSQCGGIVKKALSVRTHVCTCCGYIADRDINAAKNILQAGMRPSSEGILV